VLEFGLATRTMPGTEESGDLHLIHEYSQGVMAAAMDGLGHGPEAAFASRQCALLLMELAGEPLDAIIAKCHIRLRGTRGLVLSVCTLTEKASVWSWLGVGDVFCMLLRDDRRLGRGREFLVQRNGLVGGTLPSLIVSTMAAAPGDIMIFATDGVRTRYLYDLNPTGAPQEIAERILDRHAIGNDDALVLVARHVGGEP